MKSIVGNVEQSSRPLIVACSPREGGNSDYAAQRMEEALKAVGADPQVVHVRDFAIHPCAGCRVCAESLGAACIYKKEDQAEALFRLILGAPALFFVSPIYFYHVPAQFKGLIDRSQRYYVAKEAGDQGLAALPRRMAHGVLAGGRARGEKLFDGALLTLRYFLWPFNVTLGENLCLYGIDGPGDLRVDDEARGKVEALAVRAWKAVV